MERMERPEQRHRVEGRWETSQELAECFGLDRGDDAKGKNTSPPHTACTEVGEKLVKPRLWCPRHGGSGATRSVPWTGKSRHNRTGYCADMYVKCAQV
jgi:hypothetical protein